MTANSAAGWSLIVAVILGLVASLFTPGGLLIMQGRLEFVGEKAAA